MSGQDEHTIDWSAYPGPRDYRPEKVASALAELTSCEGATWRRAATRLRFAVGNDHAGTFYPAAVRAVDEVLAIIERGGGPPRLGGLDVLLDWVSFCPEIGFESFVDPSSGTREDASTALAARFQAALPRLRRVAADAEPEARGMCAQLIAWIEEAAADRA